MRLRSNTTNLNTISERMGVQPSYVFTEIPTNTDFYEEYSIAVMLEEGRGEFSYKSSIIP